MLPFALKIKNMEHDTIKNRTLKSANNSVLYFGKCGLRQKKEEEPQSHNGWNKNHITEN